jgi:hypothetical protein
MPTESKYNINPRMTGPGVPPHLRDFARDVDEEISFSASSESSSSVSTSSDSSSSVSV